MKFWVYKKGIRSLLPTTIVYNVGCIVIIVITALEKHKEAKFVMLFFILMFSILNVTLFYLYQNLLSRVIFEKEEVICLFLKRVRRKISYNDIVEYGIFWERQIKFIFISRIKLTDEEKEEKMFQLYKKTKDVIVLQYQEEVMNFLQTHNNITKKQ